MGILNFFKKQVVETSYLVPKLQEEVVLAKNTITELNAKLKAAAAELEKTKELAAKEKGEADAKALALKEATQQVDIYKKTEAENKAVLELKSKELAELQLAAAKAQQDADKVATNTAGSATQLESLNKKVLELQAQLSDKTQSASNLQALASKAENDFAAATTQIKETQTKYDAPNKELIELRAKMDAAGKDLEAAKSTATAAQQGLESAVKESKTLQSQIDALSKEPIDLKKTVETKTAEIAKIKVELEKTIRQKAQDKAKQDDIEQENELLLLQLMQAQEELVEYYEEKERFEKLYEIFKTRWDRLEKRQPNYFDFGEIELIAFDHASNVPSLTWRISDYAYGGQALPEFLFQIALQNEHPGIGLVTETNAVAKEDSILVPKLLAQRPQQADYFFAMSATEQRQLSAALSILAQLEANQWRGLEVPQELDLSFWKPSITQLIAQWKVLPASLRFDQVKLKRELINTDYEHLWLELHGASYGMKSWKKLEVRLGAALIQPDGFSQFPKFEIPLIDGKHKPFESWFAESYDDAGAKFELRFSLEKGVFDTAALAKLSELDRSLVLRLVYGMPAVLQKLEQQGVSIHRDWKTWQGFAAQAAQALERSRKAANSSPEKLGDSTANEIQPKIIQDTATNQQISPTAQGDASKALVNGKPNQAKIIRVSAEATHKKMSPAKKTPAPSPMSVKNKKSDTTAKDKSAVVKAPTKKNGTSTASKAQRRAA
jgi:hypothetical protein